MSPSARERMPGVRVPAFVELRRGREIVIVHAGDRRDASIERLAFLARTAIVAPNKPPEPRLSRCCASCRWCRPWREPQSPPRPVHGHGVAAFVIAGTVALALLTPFGWVHPEPVYAAQVGVAARFAPRAEDAGLVARLDRIDVPASEPRARYAYFVRGRTTHSCRRASRSTRAPERSAACRRLLGPTR